MNESQTANLSAGTHDYGSILEGIRRGEYRFAKIRTASGRLNHLIGLSRDQKRTIWKEAKRYGVGIILLGSRICGPRIRQRKLHPVLQRALPLQASKRTASPTYPGVEGVTIDKSAIKEHGLENPHTSDLTMILIDIQQRGPQELLKVATELELRFRKLGCSFPIRVYPELWGEHFYSEQDFLCRGAPLLLTRFLPQGHGFTDAHIEQALKEIYALVNLPQKPFSLKDAGAGLWNGILASVSFWLALKFHPIVFAIGFAFGFFGRYLARLKSFVASGVGETFFSNALALAIDGGIGIAVMAWIVNPIAGFGIPLMRILWVSTLHTLSKGSVRLCLDKIYSRGTEKRQSEGIVITTSVNFLQGLATTYMYAGSRTAVAIQALAAAVGLLFVFREPLMRLTQGHGRLFRAWQIDSV